LYIADHTSGQYVGLADGIPVANGIDLRRFIGQVKNCHLLAVDQRTDAGIGYQVFLLADHQRLFRYSVFCGIHQ